MRTKPKMEDNQAIWDQIDVLEDEIESLERDVDAGEYENQCRNVSGKK